MTYRDSQETMINKVLDMLHEFYINTPLESIIDMYCDLRRQIKENAEALQHVQHG